jgi:hypothetical protein
VQGSIDDLYLEPKTVISYDESCGKLLQISPKVVVEKGVRHVKGCKKGMKGLVTPQSYNFIFGCNAAGDKLPVLIGFRNKNIAIGKMKIVECRRWNNLFIGTQPCIFVFYNKADGKHLPDIFKDQILDPTLSELEGNILGDLDSLIIFQDGGCANHLKEMKNAHYLEEAKRRRQVHVKIAANATGEQQVPDLIQLFHWIKVPKQFLDKLSQSQWDGFLDDTIHHLKPLITPHFAKLKAEILDRFIETMAVLFHVTLPKLTSFAIIEEWRRLGAIPLSLEACMNKCTSVVTDEQMDGIKANAHEWTNELLRDAELSDSSMNSVLGENPFGDVSSNAPLRSKRWVIQTHTKPHEQIQGMKQ